MLACVRRIRTPCDNFDLQNWPRGLDRRRRAVEEPGKIARAERSTRLARVRRARMAPDASLRGWAIDLDPLTVESSWSKTWARIGVLTSIVALLVYVTWRILFTLPPSGWNLVAAWLLIAFELFPVFGLIIRAVTLWNIDCRAPAPVTDVGPGTRVAVFIPTYNEPVEV